MSESKTDEREMNEFIAQVLLGWTPERVYHDDPDDWEGWRDPDGAQGFAYIPEFTKVPEAVDLVAAAMWEKDNYHLELTYGEGQTWDAEFSRAHTDAISEVLRSWTANNKSAAYAVVEAACWALGMGVQA